MFRAEVQLKPTQCDTGLKHYWHIYSIDGEGNKYTIKHGYASTLSSAYYQMESASNRIVGQ